MIPKISYDREVKTILKKKNLTKITITLIEKIENWSFIIQNSNFLPGVINKWKQNPIFHRRNDEENLSILDLAQIKNENEEISIESLSKLRKILLIFYQVTEYRCERPSRSDVGLLDPEAFL